MVKKTPNKLTYYATKKPVDEFIETHRKEYKTKKEFKKDVKLIINNLDAATRKLRNQLRLYRRVLRAL